MASLRKRMEALQPRSRGVTPSNMDETNPPTRTNLINLLLLQLLQKQGEQMQQ